MKLKSIKIFEQDENIFTSNGLGIAYPSSCIIKRNLPDMTYSLELECIIDNNGKWKLFETGRIIVAKNQPFRIGIIEHDPISRTMKVYAEHIFFDLQNNFIEDTNVVDKNGSMAINQLLSHTVEPHNFVGTSDITSVNSSRCVRKQVLTALLGDQDNSFINRWGGELDIDGLTFKINKQIGSDKGYKIKYGKNLTGLNYKTNMNLNKMATKIRPVGFDGISLNEKYVISSKINDYPMPIIREIKYENVKWKGSPNFETRKDDDSFIYENLSDAQDKLRELAQKEFENGIDLLDVTLDVDFIELSKTEEYKDYKILETIELGDTVTLEYAPLGIYTKQRCVEYELDVLTDRYNSIVLGDCEPNFFNETNKVIGAVADAVISGKLNINGGISDNKIQEIISDMTEIMTNYLSGYVVITNNEILIMDTDDKETAQNVWRFNSAGIAHSSTGYNGTYTVGMTMDGHINGRIISANTIMGESMVANTVTARELAVELNKKIEDSQTKEQVEQIFAVGEGQLKSFISNTYETKTEVDKKVNNLSDDVDNKLNDKADKSTTYTKQEVNTQISQAQSNILLGVSETYETKTEVTNKLNDLSDNFDGKLSDTIVKMDVMYYLSTSTENLNGGTWSTVAPKYEDGKYMWSKTITTFKNGTTKESTPTCLSGATGKDGKGISTITNYYLASNESTGVTTSTSGWTTTIQNMSTTNKYLWNYEEVLYSDNSSITTVPIIIGVHGTNGSDGQNGVGIQSITEYYLITSAPTGVTTSTSGWTTTVQTPTLSKKYLWNYEVISYTNNTNHTGTPRIIGNYAKDGENGTNGQDGANGKGIANITEYYATSTSNTIEPTSWVTTVPTITSTNKYLWNYETITYTDNSSINTDKRVIGVYGDKGNTGSKGDTGKGISTVTNYYLATNSNSGVTASTTGWTTTVQSVSSSKKYLWNYEVIKYTDNSTTSTLPCIIGNYAKDGENGQDGKDGINGVNGQDGVSSYFYVRYSPNANGSNMTTSPNTNSLYMGTCSTTSQTAPTTPSSYQWTLIKGADGKDGVAGAKGSDGKTSYLHIKYSNDGQTFTQNNGEDIGKYIGTYVDFNQTDSTDFNDYNWKKFVGEDGQKGDTGKGISSITEYYAISTSNTTEPTTWNTTVPTMTTTNKYLWNYETIKYTDNSTINTKKRVIGVYGDKGQNGTNGTNGADGKGITSITNYYLASSSSSGVTTSTTGWTTTIQTPTKDKKYLWNYEMIKYTDNSTVNTQPCIIGNFAQDGTNGKDGTSITSSDVEYYLSTSSTSLSGGSWSTTAPTWENGKYMWSRVKTTFSSGVTSQSQPVCITGQKGDNGTNGADGRGISSITEEYYLSNSKTTQSGGSWQTTAPTWSSGKYLWTRSKIVYTNPTSTVYTTPICDNSWEAVNEIQVGGTNRLSRTDIPQTRNINKPSGFDVWDTYFTPNKQTLKELGFKIGDQITLGFNWNISKNGSNDFVYGDCRAEMARYNDSGDLEYIGVIKNPIITFSSSNTSGRSEATVTLTHEMLLDMVALRLRIDNSVLTLTISDVKLEKGTKATDWSPAPEDLLDTIKEEQTALSTNIYNELNSINSALMDIGNTNKITPQIKLNLKNMFNMANATNDKLNSLYDTVGILDAEPFKDDKDTAFNNLKNQMNSLFSNISETTVKPISEIYDLFNDFYVKSTNLEKVLNHFAQEKLNYTYANLEMLKDSIDIAVGRVDTIEGHVEEINKHFTFNTDGLTIYSTDNTATSNVSLNLDNDQMSFKDGDSVVAYVSSNKLNIENAEVKNEFIIGKFAWKPSPKGGLMLVKRSDE